MDPFEQEEDGIERRLAEGLISRKQANDELRELSRDYAIEAEEAAQEAYDNEMERW